MEEKNTETTVTQNKNKKSLNVVTVLICCILSLVIGLSGGFISAKYLISKIPQPQQSGVINQNPTNVTIAVDEKSNSTLQRFAIFSVLSKASGINANSSRISSSDLT